MSVFEEEPDCVCEVGCLGGSLLQRNVGTNVVFRSYFGFTVDLGVKDLNCCVPVLQMVQGTVSYEPFPVMREEYLSDSLG